MHRLTAASRTRTPHNQALRITAHIRVPVGQPDPYARGQRDHRRTAAITRRRAAKPTSAPTQMQVPSGNAISIRSGAGAAGPGERRGLGSAGAAWAGAGWPNGSMSPVICTGMNTGIGSGVSAPLRTCARQFHSRPRLNSCRRATAANDAPGSSTSATMRSFSSSRQRRRRSTPVMISIQTPDPDLNSPRTSAAKITSQVQKCQAVPAGRIRFAQRSIDRRFAITGAFGRSTADQRWGEIRSVAPLCPACRAAHAAGHYGCALPCQAPIWPACSRHNSRFGFA